MAGVARDVLGLKPRVDFASRRASEADATLRAGEPGDEAAFQEALGIEREVKFPLDELAAQTQEQARRFGEAFGQNDQRIDRVAVGDERRGAFSTTQVRCESGQCCLTAQANGMVCTQSPTALKRTSRTRGEPSFRWEMSLV